MTVLQSLCTAVSTAGLIITWQYYSHYILLYQLQVPLSQDIITVTMYCCINCRSHYHMTVLVTMYCCINCRSHYHMTVLQSLCTAVSTAGPIITWQYYSHCVLLYQLQVPLSHDSITVTMYCCSALCLKGLRRPTEHLGPLRKSPGRVLNWCLPKQKSVSLNQSSISQGKQTMCTSVRSYGTNSVRRGQHVLRHKWYRAINSSNRRTIAHSTPNATVTDNRNM